MENTKSINELTEEIHELRTRYINDLMSVLKDDPDATDYQKNYKQLAGYLWELSEKKSILGQLIIAIEKHLEK